MSPLVVPPHVMMVLRAITSAAENGVECPSNKALAERCSVASMATISGAIALLESANAIKVWRGKNWRVVEIVATGKRTAGDIHAIAKSWTDADDATLMEGMAEGWTYSEIAQATGRSVGACRGRFSALARQYGAQAA